MAPALLLVALALAVLAAPARALGDVFEIYTVYSGANAAADCATMTRPIYVESIRHAEASGYSMDDCLPTTVDCADLGDGLYGTKACMLDFAFKEPDELGIVPADYVQEEVEEFSPGTDNFMARRHYLANAGCTALGGGQFFQADSDGQTHTVKTGCDATCASCASVLVGEDCDWLVGVDGYGHGLDYEPASETACWAAPYTTPLGDFEAAPVDANVPIRDRRTCWALEGGTVYGGWKVTAGGETYCCTERGTYDSGSATAFGGCDGSHAHTADFFYDEVTATTYQHCYSGYEPETCLFTPTSDGPDVASALVQGGAQVAEEPQGGTLPRNFAISVECNVAGAYLLETSDDNEYFCTGRGVVVDDGGVLRCRMNGCDHATPHYFTIGQGEEGVFCYHTCYALPDA